jgi:glycosyltransferase involved in cell wall biosynthesis
MSTVQRVVRNDWSSVAVPALNRWRPSMTVTVVIPAYQCQDTVDLALASLSRQTYPAELLDVIVVDDGSEPPLRLPEIRPKRTTLLRPSTGWGKANAQRAGVEQSAGDILLLLDADMVVYPEHVAAHARWHHAIPYCVTLGSKRFVDPPWPSSEAVVQAWERGTPDDLFGGRTGERHEYVERYVAQTSQLRTADHLAFRIHVGATVGLRRGLYDLAGGPDPALRFGNDTEFGYRLAQSGAVFVPETLARSWHLGATHVMRAQEQIARYRMAFLADLVPYPRHWRKVGGTSWTVPLVEVALTVRDEPLERVRAAVDSILRGTDSDVRVNLIGPWDRLNPDRVPALTDPQLDLRLIAATYRGEARVRLITEPLPSAFPSPYLLEMSASHGLVSDSIQRLIALADHHQVGAVQVEASDGGGDVLLWRTAAVGRAGWVRAAGESLLDAVAATYGVRRVTSTSVGVVDLTQFDPSELAAGTARLFGDNRKRPRTVTSVVEVEGARSLARATILVARLGGRRLTARLRRATSWGVRRLRHVTGAKARRTAGDDGSRGRARL